MMNKSPFFSLFFILVTLFTGLTTGCAKGLNLSIKADEAEKDQPSTALARKVELTYHDESGDEKLRESISVYGLSQPVSVKKEGLKDLNWTKDGIFEARAYTGDGLLLMRGVAQVDPDETSEIELVLSRESSQETQLNSTLIRRIRIANSQNLTEFQVDARALQEARTSNRCVEVPLIRLEQSAGQYPAFVFESSIKAPELNYDLGENTTRQKMNLSLSGDPIVELNPQFSDGKLFNGLNHFQLRVFSNEYEGCLNVSTSVALLPIVAYYNFGAGFGANVEYPNSTKINPVVLLTVSNPNLVSVVGLSEVFATETATGKSIAVIYSTVTGELYGGQTMKTMLVRDETWLLKPNESRTIGIYGGGTDRFLFKGFKLGWKISAWPEGASRADSLPTQSIEVIVP